MKHLTHRLLFTILALVSGFTPGCANAGNDESSSEHLALGDRCTPRELTFSADSFPSMPADGTAFVWGANGSGGEEGLYTEEFLAEAKTAHERNLEVFAYLEGPCGDTGGVDDGERDRCESIHRKFNEEHAPDTADTPEERWKPYTIAQLKASKAANVDYCEIDNLANNVTIPLNPLMEEIKRLYDSGEIQCRLVLKNVDEEAIDSLRENVAPTPQDADFIAPFHIYEADDTDAKSRLDAAMNRLKGDGAVTIISLDTNHYGSAFTSDTFVTCPR